MANSIKVRGRSLKDLMAVKSHADFHDYLLHESVERYRKYRESKNLPMGSVFAVCANAREARVFGKYSFDRVVLSGIVEPDRTLQKQIENNPKIQYVIEDAEKLRQAAQAFDLVVCKEGIHHLARPVLGLLEMLRVTSAALIVIEPADTLIGRFLESLGLSHVYESNQVGNVTCRNNYVYRWDVRRFRDILNSYYLESGYTLDITQGWMSLKANCHPSASIRFLSALVGWLASFCPGSKGNYMSALILAGSDLPGWYSHEDVNAKPDALEVRTHHETKWL